MAYTQTSLDSILSQIGQNLDDTNEKYWTRTEKIFAVWEALRVWGSITNYWRTRGSFVTATNQPYYDLSVELPALRPRAWTLNQVVTQLQYMLLEAPNGISGSGMSGQVSVTSILQTIQRARNRFVLDCKFPYSVGPTIPVNATPDGLIQIPDSCMYLHRAGWQDLTSGTWANLWRQDSWAIDHNRIDWAQNPGRPVCYSESELSPIQIQLDPAPIASGNLEIITVDSLQVDITDPNATFDIPDEWIYGVIYCALSDLLCADSQLNDPFRGQYAQMRYDQAVDSARLARCMTRLMLNGNVLQLDSFAAMDAAMPTWRNQTGQPQVAGSQYDFLALANVPDAVYGITADVVQAAPLPSLGGDFIQIGYEDIPHIVDYCVHHLMFKCGGTEFKSTFADYDDYMKSAASRGRINAAKIRYLEPVFGQPQRDQAMRPDRMEKANA